MSLTSRRERLVKEVRLSYRKGGRSHVAVVREHYLRDDIACKLRDCVICRGQAASTSLLTCRGEQPLVVPDADALRAYLEVFENSAISGVILLETAVTHVRTKAGRQYHSRVLNLIRGLEKDCIYFSNEHHLGTFMDRWLEESVEQWQCRLVYRAAHWYSQHLRLSGRMNPVIVVSRHEQHYHSLDNTGKGCEGVQVKSVEAYLKLFHPHVVELLALCESLTASLDDSQREEGTSIPFSSTLSDQAIQDGISKGEFFVGTLRVSRGHAKEEAFVSPGIETMLHRQKLEAAGSSVILIHGQHYRNHAIHGDTVAVQLLPRSQWRGRCTALPATDESRMVQEESKGMPTGAVVAVIERCDREYVASFAETSENSRQRVEKVLVYPYDRRIPKVKILTRQAEQLKYCRIVVRIDSWDADSQYPCGHFVRSIGRIGTIETETAVILIEHGLSVLPFSISALRELPVDSDECPWQVDEEEVRQRRDLRCSHLVFSIDPKGCEDVDDTLSVRSLDKGCIELGVHIADVSYFVQPRSHLDSEAQHRSTTVYFADRRYDMLPAMLSSNLCSLLSNVDRYAVSVICQLDCKYNVKDVWFGRTIIKSSYKLAYETAQALYDVGPAATDAVKDIPELWEKAMSHEERVQRVDHLCTAIRSLVNISRVLRQRRSNEGALELEGVEVRVQLSDKDSSVIEDLIPKQPLEMHETIAECMIFANSCVAEKISSSLPTCSLLRRHPPPLTDNLTTLVESASTKGWRLKVDSNKALSKSLDACVDPVDPDINKLLRMLATGAMSQAEYFSTGSLHSTDFYHYGLALKCYTHFTSPIRRYADLVVHRQLLSIVGTSEKEVLLSNTDLIELTRHMNGKHREAKWAQRASVEFFQALYFSKNHNQEGGKDELSDTVSDDRCQATGIISSIKANGIKVFVPRYGIEGSVYLKNTSGDVAQPDPCTKVGVVFLSGEMQCSHSSMTVTHSTGQYTLQLFDRVQIRIVVRANHSHAHTLTFNLISCGPVIHSVERSTGQKDIVKAATLESALVHKQTMSPLHLQGFKQSEPERSLYSLVKSMYQLSLREV